MYTLVEPKRKGKFPAPVLPVEKRRASFCEVQLSYTPEEVIEEAQRCLLCGNPACMDACPVQLDVRGMNEAVSRGDFATAYRRIRETNPLLGTCARVCPQLDGLCEAACHLNVIGEPIAVGMIQRFVADWERNGHPQPLPSIGKDTGKRVAVIGAGPAGLAAAELLRRYGHAVTIYEQSRHAGGTAWYGIPDYHLSKDVLQYEIDQIRRMGVEIKTGISVGKDVTLSELLQDGADAVLIATGAKDVTPLMIPGSDLRGVIDGYRFLEDVFMEGVQNYLRQPKYDLGNKVLVIGGGDSAIDSARTALRLTNGEVTIMYRRTAKELPAYPLVVSEAQEEGVKFRFLVEPKAFNGVNGRLVSATFSVMKLGEPDSSGRRRPVPTGEEITVECSSVIIAIGRGPNTSIQSREKIRMNERGAIIVDEKFMTSMPGVFAAGDVTTGETLVVKAAAAGRQAAQRIHEYLMGLEDKHVSLYDRYFKNKSYYNMLYGIEEGPPPP
ncbi:MAG: FAD-dependent oxidoreductase [Conexivisphaerales archaeon]